MRHRLNMGKVDFATMSSLYPKLTWDRFSKKINLIFENFFHWNNITKFFVRSSVDASMFKTYTCPSRRTKNRKIADSQKVDFPTLYAALWEQKLQNVYMPYADGQIFKFCHKLSRTSTKLCSFDAGRQPESNICGGMSVRRTVHELFELLSAIDLTWESLPLPKINITDLVVFSKKIFPFTLHGICSHVAQWTQKRSKRIHALRVRTKILTMLMNGSCPCTFPIACLGGNGMFHCMSFSNTNVKSMWKTLSTEHSETNENTFASLTIVSPNVSNPTLWLQIVYIMLTYGKSEKSEFVKKMG